ncbi:unnamed protein product [Plutella xylostella]|uniref:(diamondback moth) hypothetical protein n=1 Tax=Plutella xylostella TaxID=51655 RepID=A0A8S4FP36_PLUXY|nr:unnamed protein product [Plutella xylostella]
MLSTGPPRLIALDSTKPGFSEALRRIDSTGPRAAVTVHVMYARAGQTVARDIVANSSTPLPSAFVHMLRGVPASSRKPFIDNGTRRRPRTHARIRNEAPHEHLVRTMRAVINFSEALRRIDSTGPRAAVTVHVMYARAGQTVARDIVANSSTPLPSAFVHMLRGLGTPVRVRTHPGWTGHVSTSYDAARELGDSAPPPPSQGQAPCVYDGREQVLYWSDATNEIAFVVPSLAAHSETDENKNESVRSDVDGSCLSSSTRTSEKPEGSCWDMSSNSSGAPSYERSISESDRGEKRVSLSEKTRALSLELDKQAGLTGSGRRNREYSTKILIIWLEDFEDHLNMPIDDLLQYCDTGLPWRRHGTCVISVSGRRSGLVRVRTAAPGAGPLADGALLAPHLLPDCLRRAALDVAARRRLNSDT